MNNSPISGTCRGIQFLCNAILVTSLILPALPASAKATVEASDHDKTKPLVTNVFFDTRLRQALADVAAQTGTTIIPDASVQGLVTIELTKVPLEEALRMLLAGTGNKVQKMDGYYLVYSNKPNTPAFQQLSETKRINLRYLKGGEAKALLPETLKRYVQVATDTDLLSVTAPPKLFTRIHGDIKELDQPPAHVMLDARVVILEHSDLLDLGVEWDWPQVSAGTFSDAAHHGGASTPEWPWGIRIGYTPGKDFTNSLLLTLNLLRQNGDATIVATPRVLAQDHKSAAIKVTTEEYFEISTGGYYEDIDLETIETGTILQIVPRIGDNGEITLDMNIEVSDVVSRGENNLPVVTRRSTTNTVRVRDGGTAAIAGLASSQTQRNYEKVPGLGSVPGLGRLFRSDANRQEAKQVAIFVTASLVRDTDETVSAQLRADRQKFQTVDPAVFREKLRKSLNRLNKKSSQ